MIRTLAWKEYREQRSLWLALVFLAMVATAVVVEVLEPHGLLTTFKVETLFGIGVLVSLGFGLVSGALLLGGDREAGTLAFLDQQLASRSVVWRTKVVTGLALVLPFAAVLALIIYSPVRIVSGYFKHPLLVQDPSSIPVLLVIYGCLGLEGLVFGLWGGALMRTVQKALIFSMGTVLFLWVVCLAFWADTERLLFVPLVQAALTVGALGVSWRIFCRPDWERNVPDALHADTAVSSEAKSRFFMLWLAVGVGVAAFAGVWWWRLPRWLPPGMRYLSAIQLAVLANILGAGCGIALLAGIRAERLRTATTWDRSGARRLWERLLTRALLLSLIVAAIIASPAMIGFPLMLGLPFPGLAALLLCFLLALLLSLEGFAWSLWITCICPSVWLAGLLSLLMLGLVWIVTLWNWWSAEPNWFALPTVRLLLAALALWRAESGYYPRIPGMTATGNVPRHVVTEARSPYGWRVLAWLIWQQSRNGVLGILIGAIVVALYCYIPMTLLTSGEQVVHAMIYAVLTGGVAVLIFGVCCGVGVFAGEQAWQAQRFLGNQRLPAGRIWFVKIAFWLVVGTGAAAIVAMPGALPLLRDGELWPGVSWETVESSMRSQSWQNNLPFIAIATCHLLHPILLIFIALIYGFSIGQLLAFLVQRPAAAAILALVISPVASIWLPSVIGGGLHIGQVIGPPLMLLLATCVTFRHWAGGSAPGRSPMVLGSIAAAVLLLAGGLWYRVAEVPAVPEPFDVAAYEAAAPTPEQNRAGRIIRTAIEEFQKREKKAAALFPNTTGLRSDELTPLVETVEAVLQPARSLLGQVAGGVPVSVEIGQRLLTEASVIEAASQAPSLGYGRIDLILHGGWPANDPSLTEELDYLSGGGWIERLAPLPGLPVGVLEPVPGQTRGAEWQLGNEASQLARVLRARALQLQAQGQNRKALDQLAFSLAVSRTLRHRSLSTLYSSGESVESATLETLDRWLQRLGPQPELIGQAINVLQQHIDQLPSAEELVETAYVHSQRAHRSGTSALAIASLPAQAPWETERQLRIDRGVTAGLLESLEVDFAHWARVYREGFDQTNSRISGPGEVQLRQCGWIPPAAGPGAQLTLARMGQFVEHATVIGDLSGWSNRVLDALNQSRRRANLLKLALAQYAAREHHSAPRLDALVPHYLTALPADPFTGKSFYYRVSAGERIGREKEPLLQNAREGFVMAGQGVLWSTGPDMVNDGGTVARNHAVQVQGTWWQPGGDLIYLVPVWPER